MDNINSIIEKVQKLLNLASSKDSPHEAELAARMADNLIQKYRISAQQLSDKDPNKASEMCELTQPLYSYKRIITWRYKLAVAVSKHYGCFIFLKQLNGDKCLMIAGTKEDVAIASTMYNWLVSTILSLSMKNSKNKGKSYSNSYSLGVVRGIETQFLESREEVVSNYGEHALVKLDDKLNQAEKWLKSIYQMTKKSITSNINTDCDAFSSGAEDGYSLHLGKSLPNNATHQLKQ